jgi:hypothetical protein
LEEAKQGSECGPLVFLDMVMPVADGNSTAELWRAIEHHLKRPRAFICSVSAQEGGFDARFMDFQLKKPILFAEVKEVFEKRANIA